MLDGRRLSVGRSFKTSDGATWTNQWATVLSDEEKTAVGITWVADPEPFDGKYYYSAGNPRQLDNSTDSEGNVTPGVRPSVLKEQKVIAGQLLSSTDWYVVRKSETDVAIPSNVATYRAAVRTVCGTREAEIAAVSTTEALEALMKAPDKITNDAGEVVDNPAAHLTPWPVLAE